MRCGHFKQPGPGAQRGETKAVGALNNELISPSRMKQ